MNNNVPSISTKSHYFKIKDRRGRNRMVVGFTTTYAIGATNVVRSNPAHGEVYNIT
jgi:hypothetical protein